MLTDDQTFAEDGTPVFTRSFLRDAVSVGEARQFVHAALLDWKMPELADTAELVVSELASNAVMHARRASFRVTVVRLDDDRARVVVIDHSCDLPQSVDARADEAHGRGLAIVEAVSAQWGTEPLNWGKKVWADLEKPQVLELPVDRDPMNSRPLAQLVYVLILVAVAAAVISGVAARC
ncbi:ATP-binding protein [Streptomyces sp. NPDC047061]|uniref:ATP-binding protein n=1 Tax=Streptomyces sp. NPDC047061 TaxID=3154605 RepID=UPI0033E1C5D1